MVHFYLRLMKNLQLYTALSILIATNVLAVEAYDEPAFKPNQSDTIKVPKIEDDYINNNNVQTSPAPANAKNIFFQLNNVVVDGFTAFSDEDFKQIYGKYLNQRVSLDVAWKIASDITLLYRKNGYVLSLAYVPQQELHNGVLKLKVVEGHIVGIQLKEGEDSQGDNYVLKQHINHLKSANPVKSSDIESFILKIRDLYGISYKAVMKSVKDDVKELIQYKEGGNHDIHISQVQEGAIKLILIPSKEKWSAGINVDNNGSVYYSPHAASVYFSNSFIPLHSTTVSAMNSMPTDHFHYLSLDHKINLIKDINLDMHAEVQASQPGDSLKDLKMKGKVDSYSFGIQYNPIRQRRFNLYLKSDLVIRNGQNKILGLVSNEDKSRVLKLSINTDWIDSFIGFNSFGIKYSKGLDIMSASKKDSATIRANTNPEFSKVDLSLARLQGLTNDVFLYASTVCQYTNDVIFASEEFGYGGRQFGRAFDLNELKGFKGHAYNIELRYEGIDKIKNVVKLHPYTFYDAGKVWSRAKSSSTSETYKAASSGIGIRFSSNFNTSGGIAVAFPVDGKISKPIYKGSQNGPRVLLNLSQSF